MINDVEKDLRATMLERAHDISQLPESVFAFERDPAAVTETVSARGLSQAHPPFRGRPQLLAGAAGIVTVLAVAATVVAVRDGGRSTVRPANSGAPTAPVATTAPIPPTPIVRTPQVRRTALLSWFGVAALPGYHLSDRESFPGHRSLNLSVRGDNGAIAGSNGAAPSTTSVTVFDRGRFDETRTRTWRKVVVAGKAARVGRLGLVGDLGGTPLPRLAMKSPPGRWVVVQGRSVRSSTATALSTVAAAIRPDALVDWPVPFRLGYLPADTSVTGLYQDLTETNWINLELSGPRLGLVVSLRPTFSTHVAGHKPQRRTINGVNALVFPTAGVADTTIGVDTTVQVQATTPAGRPSLDRAQQQEFGRFLDGITWLVRDGRGTPVRRSVPSHDPTAPVAGAVRGKPRAAPATVVACP